MSLESAIYSRLSGYAGLSALVGTRIYTLRAPQQVTAPWVTFQRIDTVPVSAMGVDAALTAARVQVDAWATADYDAARAVAVEIKGALQRWRQSSGTVIQDSFLEGETDLWDDDDKVWRVSLDFIVHYEEA